MKKLIVFLAIALMANVASGAAILDILVDDVPWVGQDVEPSQIITVTWVDDVSANGGFGDFGINVSNGDLYEGTEWIVQAGWLAPPYIALFPKTEGFDVSVAAMGFPAPTGEIMGWSFHVPLYKQESDYIIIDPDIGSWNGVFGVPGPDDLLPYVVLHVIPEPMTIALLGLGGLFLVRRRRK